jgi:hypothetical protein
LGPVKRRCVNDAGFRMTTWSQSKIEYARSKVLEKENDWFTESHSEEGKVITSRKLRSTVKELKLT